MGVWYASREDVMQVLDTRAAAYTSGQIDRAIDSASRNVEGLCHRIFYPLTATKYFDFPNWQRASTGRLWLDGNEIVSVTNFVSGGVTIPQGNYFLEPNMFGPPYDRIDVNLGSTSALAAGPNTWQQSLAVTGVWMGCAPDEASAGTLAAAVSTTSATTITVAGANIGVGRVLRIDTERMIVTEKTYISSGQSGTLTLNLNAQILAVSDSTVFKLREELLIDAERVLVIDIAGNNLIVKRAYAGTTLAAHTASTIYFGRQLTVTRGALGTTAATHLTAAPIARHLVPPLAEELTVAYALIRGLNESVGYARFSSSGESEARGTAQRAIADLEANVKTNLGQRARQRAV
jgi:hypothetical protein